MNSQLKASHLILFLIIFITSLSFTLASNIVCKYCKFDENESSSKYCDQCGESLTPKILCSECAFENFLDGQYCLNCTAELPTFKPFKKPSKTKQKIKSKPKDPKSLDFPTRKNELTPLPQLIPKSDESQSPNEGDCILYIDNSSSSQLEIQIDDFSYTISPYQIKKIKLLATSYNIMVFEDPELPPSTYKIQLTPDVFTILNPDKKGIYELIREAYTTQSPMYGRSGYKGPPTGVFETIQGQSIFTKNADFGMDKPLPSSVMVQKLWETRTKLKKGIKDISDVNFAYHILMQKGVYYDIETIYKALSLLESKKASNLALAAINVLSYPLGMTPKLRGYATDIIFNNWSPNYPDLLIKSAEQLNIENGYYQAFSIIKILLDKVGVIDTKKIFSGLNEKTLRNLTKGLSFPGGGVARPKRNKARPYVPLLIKCIKSTDELTRGFACQGLTALRPSLTDDEVVYLKQAIDTLSDEKLKNKLLKKI